MPLHVPVPRYTYFIGQSASQGHLSSNEHRRIGAWPPACKKEPSAAATSERRSRSGDPTPPRLKSTSKSFVAQIHLVCAPLLTLPSDSKAHQPNHITGERQNFYVHFQREFHEFEGTCSECSLLPRGCRCLYCVASALALSAERTCKRTSSVEVCASRPRSFSVSSDSFLHQLHIFSHGM